MIAKHATAAVLVTVSAVAGVMSFGDEPFVPSAASPEKSSSTVDSSLVSLETARAQATSLHAIIHSALRVTHDRYYLEDEGLPIPAAAFKEVFEDLKEKQNITLRWLVVEGQAMNSDHKAQNEFEEAAVKAIKSGKPSHEQFENGVYQRAAPITLSNHCLKCHVPDRRSTRDRKAGLIVSVPVASR